MFRTPDNQDPVLEGRQRRERKPATERGFMGMTWDAKQIAFNPELWEKCYRVLTPGGVLKAFCGTRTYHKMAMAIEGAGFTDLQLVGWGYGSGMPKSHDTSKQIDLLHKQPRPIVGYKRGVGGQNMNDIVRGAFVRDTSAVGAKGVGAYGVGAKQRPIDIPVTVPATKDAQVWTGWGTGLKPAWEPVIIARKSL